ncbi:IEC3 subunit of the Ino80 complex, chromatin re-modelling-domain-containing protein [Peziza echinospora]|nr:IEC3 subunit of the Ino80 complex, chromatin re-modelling-domain-containing protein [Peziza echinospora]
MEHNSIVLAQPPPPTSGVSGGVSGGGGGGAVVAPSSTHKSYKRKYRKLKNHFDSVMKRSDDLFRKDIIATAQVKRITEENIRLLDLLLDLNSSSHIPKSRYRNIGSPSCSTPLGFLSPQQLAQYEKDCLVRDADVEAMELDPPAAATAATAATVTTSTAGDTIAESQNNFTKNPVVDDDDTEEEKIEDEDGSDVEDEEDDDDDDDDEDDEEEDEDEDEEDDEDDEDMSDGEREQRKIEKLEMKKAAAALRRKKKKLKRAALKANGNGVKSKRRGGKVGGKKVVGGGGVNGKDNNNLGSSSQQNLQQRQGQQQQDEDEDNKKPQQPQTPPFRILLEPKLYNPGSTPEYLRDPSPFLLPVEEEEEYYLNIDQHLDRHGSRFAADAAGHHHLLHHLHNGADVPVTPTTAAVAGEKDDAFGPRNPMSVYCWLKRNQPHIFLQDPDEGAGGGAGGVGGVGASNGGAAGGDGVVVGGGVGSGRGGGIVGKKPRGKTGPKRKSAVFQHGHHDDGSNADFGTVNVAGASSSNVATPVKKEPPGMAGGLVVFPASGSGNTGGAGGKRKRRERGVDEAGMMEPIIVTPGVKGVGRGGRRKDKEREREEGGTPLKKARR